MSDLTLHDVTDDHRADDLASNYGVTANDTFVLMPVPVAAINGWPDVTGVADIADEESADWTRHLIAAGPDDMEPIVLTEMDGGTYAIIDGHHRWVALLDLHVDTVEAYVCLLPAS